MQSKTSNARAIDRAMANSCISSKEKDTLSAQNLGHDDNIAVNNLSTPILMLLDSRRRIGLSSIKNPAIPALVFLT
jgi:hypothetical protein